MKKALFIFILLFSFTNIQAFDKPKPKHKSGYNYKAHSKKSAKYKRNNERGNYMKCKRNH